MVGPFCTHAPDTSHWRGRRALRHKPETHNGPHRGALREADIHPPSLILILIFPFPCIPLRRPRVLSSISSSLPLATSTRSRLGLGRSGRAAVQHICEEHGEAGTEGQSISGQLPKEEWQTL